MAQVQNALMDKVDTIDVALAPWPACEARLTLDDAINESDLPQVAALPEAPALGDALNIGIETPGFPSYLYAAYFAADGNVLEHRPAELVRSPSQGRPHHRALRRRRIRPGVPDGVPASGR